MIIRIFRMAASFLVAAIVLSSGTLAAPFVSAKSAVLLDADTGRIIWQIQGNEKSLIASTTKIMTCLLVAEECDLKEIVCIPAEAVGIEGSSIYLREGELITVEALLYGLMLHSGNDAAVALALHHSQTLEAFAEGMNRKAKELGLGNTNYKNPHGLDEDGHYSTAEDLARLTAFAMGNNVFREIVSSKSASFGTRVFTNHNKMLWKYHGAIGVKTGYTKAAGRILVSSAERNGREIICVTISDPYDWKDHGALLDYGFEMYQEKKLLDADKIEIKVPVMHGCALFASIGISEDFSYPIADDSISIVYRVPNYAVAPVFEGETAGEISILNGERVIAKVPVIWLETVMEKS